MSGNQPEPETEQDRTAATEGVGAAAQEEGIVDQQAVLKDQIDAEDDPA